MGDKKQAQKFSTKKQAKKSSDGTCQARSWEIVFDCHIKGDLILDQIRQKTYGLYKGFVKWHNIGGPHTHVGVMLREKPKIRNSIKYFTVNVGDLGDISPKLQKPLGKGNTSPLKKLATYVEYLTDGHDNGHFEDTWNYKFDYELDRIKTTVGRVLCLFQRGQTWEEIWIAASWDERAELAKNKKAALSAWREHKKIVMKPKPIELRPWQSECLATVKKQDDRKILWIFDADGNNGKTKLCKEMALHHNTAVFGNAGKKDLAFAYDDQEIVAFNLTRTTQERVNYEAMEALKDGLMFSGKYESETKVFDSPKLVVMSNTLPDYEAMSLDRWHILELNGGALTELPSTPPPGDTLQEFLESTRDA